MSWLQRLFRGAMELPPELNRRVEAWRALPAVSAKVAIRDARFVVVDVETSGLDPDRDRLLAIGAVAVEAMQLRPVDGLDVIVRQDERSERENILVHGIGPQMQTGGVEPAEALTAFLEFARKDPLIACHAWFDQTALQRALRRHLGVPLPNPWIDVALLAPALFPDRRRELKVLDQWLSYFGLMANERHRAADDAFVTAELFLILLKRAHAKGVADLAGLRSLTRSEADLARQLQPGGA